MAGSDIFHLFQKLLKVNHFLDSDVGWHGVQELLTKYLIFNFVKIIPFFLLVGLFWLAGSDIFLLFQKLFMVNHFLDSDVGWHGVQELLTEQ